MRRFVVLALLATSGLVLAPGGAGGNGRAPAPDRTRSLPSRAELANLGTLFVVRHGVLHPELHTGDIYRGSFATGVQVPPPGGTAWGITDFKSRPTEAMGIHVDLDGSVRVYTKAAEPGHDRRSAAGPAGPSLPACDPGTANFWDILGFTWPGTFNWYFNAGSTPNELDVDNTRNSVLEGARHIPQAYNDCGLPDNVNTNQFFRGDISQSVDMDSSGNCLTQNGTSVIGFGTLPNGVLGRTCPSQLYGGSLSADVRLDKANTEWTNNPGGTCSNKWDVESVATHERGHVFGLAHPTQAGADRQTMWATYPDCVTWNRTLGRGDVNGLEFLY